MREEDWSSRSRANSAKRVARPSRPSCASHRKKLYWVAAVLALATTWTMPTFAEEPVKLTVCQLLEDPGRYNHRLIEINGTVNRGFENFTLSDRACDTHDRIWLEFGGERGTGAVYCCGVPAETKRKSTLVVEGVETRLVVDAMFKKISAAHSGEDGHGACQGDLDRALFLGNARDVSGGHVLGRVRTPGNGDAPRDRASERSPPEIEPLGSFACAPTALPVAYAAQTEPSPK